MEATIERSLSPLLTYLDQERPDSSIDWEGWTILPVSGGANNRLYQATSADTDLPVKWTLRDERDRSGREYAALTLLEHAGVSLAPRAVTLESRPLPAARRRADLA